MNDTGDLSNADLERDLRLLAQFAPKTPTNNSVYQEINNQIDGEIDVLGRPLTPDEIQEKIGDNMFNLDEEDFQELDQRNIVTKRNLDNANRTSESAGLKARIKNQVLRNIKVITKDLPSRQRSAILFGEGLNAFANSIATDYSSRYYRQVNKERASGERIFAISNEIEQTFLKENGLWTGKGAPANVTVPIDGEIIRHFRGKSDAKPQFKLVPVETKEKEEEQ